MCSRWHFQHPVAGYAALSAWFTDMVVQLLDSLAMESLYNKHSKDKEKHKRGKLHTCICANKRKVIMIHNGRVHATIFNMSWFSATPFSDYKL